MSLLIMKSYIFNLLVVLFALFSLDFIGAERGSPNKYTTPEPAGICKTALVKLNGTQNPNGACSSQIIGACSVWVLCSIEFYESCFTDPCWFRSCIFIR